MRIAALALILAGTVTVEAQQRPQRPQQAAPAPPAPVQPPPPPTGYEPPLLRLSEILGAVTYLTELCAAPGVASAQPEAIRQKMRDLIDTEAQTAVQRERYAGAYNQGFIGYQATHRVCTPVSQLALERLVQEGAKLSAEINARFGS